MTDSSESIAALLTPSPSAGVQFSQGTILTWDTGTTLSNSIDWRGVTLTDVPMVEGVNNLALKPGDIVGMLGWTPTNSKGVGSWWIIGKLSGPGEQVSDLTFYLGQVRFLTRDDGYPQMYIGQSATTGKPMTAIYYGDEGSTQALIVYNQDAIFIRDPSNNIIFSNDASTQVGIGKPYFTYRLEPAFTAQSVGEGNGSMWPSTTSTSYVDMLIGNNPVWHPRITVGVGNATTGGGSAEWTFSINGTTLHTSTATGTVTVSVPGWGTTITPGESAQLRIAGRCTGGATRAWFNCDRLYGTQS